jgi:hypothetical protein
MRKRRAELPADPYESRELQACGMSWDLASLKIVIEESGGNCIACAPA